MAKTVNGSARGDGSVTPDSSFPTTSAPSQPGASPGTASAAVSAAAGGAPQGPPSPAPASQRPRHRLIALLGPAFVAAVAYVDPGNVAANITAGARYGYLLVWVLVAANIMAVLIQYQSAKLGIVTGDSLPVVLRPRLSRHARLTYVAQAELVAIATDLAEIVGGAIALNLLFDLPLLAGGLIIGAVSIALLAVQQRRSQRAFEGLIMTLLVIITLGFVGGLVLAPPDWSATAHGLLPRLEGTDSLLVAASMLGATVMPHAIYLHSSLVRDHHEEIGEGIEQRRLSSTNESAQDDTASSAAETVSSTTAEEAATSRTHLLVRATRIDVIWALAVAGCVNIALLLLAASALAGVEGTDTIEGAHAAITAALGSGVGIVFAIGLLASGLASTSVGAYAGAEILQGLLHVRIPVLLQRLITLVPALVIIAIGTDPTWALVLSQVVLSFGIPFALIPLMRLTGSQEVMGQWRDGAPLRWTARVVAVLIIALNIALLYLTFTGQA